MRVSSAITHESGGRSGVTRPEAESKPAAGAETAPGGAVNVRVSRRALHRAPDTAGPLPASAEYTTPWGTGRVISWEGRPVAVELPGRARDVGAGEAGRHSPAVGDIEVAVLWASRLSGFFAGRGPAWSAEDIDVASWLGQPPGSFTVQVYEVLTRVPAGTVLSYGELACRAGRPRAARAVGTAMARNPLPLLVPCHRVVRSDGDIGAYGGGRLLKGRSRE